MTSARSPAASAAVGEAEQVGGVDVTVATRVWHVAAGERDRLRTASIERQHAAGEHAVGVAHTPSAATVTVGTEPADVGAQRELPRR